MAETDPVRIVVEIIDEFSDDLEKLREQLRKLDKSRVNPEFELDDDGDIESVRAQLEALRKKIETAMDIDVEGEEYAFAVKSMLAQDVTSAVRFTTEGGMDDVLRDLRRFDINEALGLGGPSGVPNLDMRFRDLDSMGAPDVFAPTGRPFQLDNLVPDTDFGFGDGFSGGRGFFGQSFGVHMARSMNRANKSFTNFGKTLLQYRPSIMDWWNVLALLIPIIITLAGALIGLAAALGAVAVGAGAIIGFGLLGWGEDTQSMMQNLQTEAQKLKSELFAVFKPVGDVFQPVLEGWIEGAPDQLSRLTDELKMFVDFAGPLESMGDGFIDWIEEVLVAMHSLGGEASQVLLRMGGALGDFLIDALTTMLMEVYKNQDAYIRLAEILLGIVVAIFNVSKVITFVVAQFGWLIEILVWLTELLSNETVVIILTLLTALWMVGFALEALAGILATVLLMMNGLATGPISRAILGMYGLATSAWAAFAGLTAVQKAMVGILALSGIGLLWAFAAPAIADSMTPPSGNGGFGGGRGGGGPRNTNITINGDVREREMDRLLDEIGPGAKNEMSFQERMG